MADVCFAYGKGTRDWGPVGAFDLIAAAPTRYGSEKLKISRDIISKTAFCAVTGLGILMSNGFHSEGEFEQLLIVIV